MVYLGENFRVGFYVARIQNFSLETLLVLWKEKFLVFFCSKFLGVLGRNSKDSFFWGGGGYFIATTPTDSSSRGGRRYFTVYLGKNFRVGFHVTRIQIFFQKIKKKDLYDKFSIFLAPNFICFKKEMIFDFTCV